jgi:hypothetical protein
MAISNFRLNVTANTARALSDFNKFSRSLDNKFLISGLKLDVVRSSLNQITQEFQRAIGEQGLASASSFRAAQNQAALLTQTFKGFAAESALSITQNIGTALNSVAVKAGGTMKDVQKTLAATPFISTRIGDEMRDSLTKGIMAAQVNMRRAGLGDNFGGVVQQFLRGNTTGMQMVNSADASESFLGAEILKRVGGEGKIYSPEMRSKILNEIVNDPKIQEQLNIAAKRASGFKIILEDLNTKLFNPEFGVFGALRKIVDASGKTTTMFDEVEYLIDQVFGPNGMFATLVNSIRSVFGQGDAMRPLIDLVQFTTRTFKSITEFLNSPTFKGILFVVKDAFSGISETFSSIYDEVKSGNFTADDIVPMIEDIGTSVRDYIKSIGRFIRDTDDEEAIGFVGEIGGTLLSELGKTAVVMVKELFSILVDKVPTLVTAVLPAINQGINSLLTEAFGEIGGKIAKLVLGFVPGIGAIARASAVGDVTGGGGSMGSALAMGAGALLGPAALFGAARLGRGLFGGDQARSVLLARLTGRANTVEELYNSRARQLGLPGAQRSPLSRLLGDLLAPRSRTGGFTTSDLYDVPLYTRGQPRRRISRTIYKRPAPVRLDIPKFDQLQSDLTGGNRTTSDLYDVPLYTRGQPRRRISRTVYKRPAPVRLDIGTLASRFMAPFSRAGQGVKNLAGNVSSSYMSAVSNFHDRIFPPRGPEPPIFPRGPRVTGYTNPIGPQPHGYDWAYAPGYGGVGGDYAPYIESSVVGPKERLSRASQTRRRRARFGKAALVGGLGLAALGIIGASAPPGMAQGMEGGTGGSTGPNWDKVGSSLGGGFEGAMTGAAIGSIIPGIGTAAGAVIGGVIGGVAPFIDKGTKDGARRFIEGVKKWFDDLINGVGQSIYENGSKFKNFMGDSLRFLANGIITIANSLVSALQIIPKIVMSVVNAIYSKIPHNDTLDSIVGAGNTLANFQIPKISYGGKNVYGMAMDMEQKMSGNRPMIVNDSEFVIPKGGMPVLTDAVARKLNSRASTNAGPIQVQVNLSLTTHSFVANPDELSKALKEPVYQIISDAWVEATNANRTHRSRTN